MPEPDPWACDATDEVVCPFCGEHQGDSWELGDGGEGDGETDCGDCGKRFLWSRHISVSYSSKKPPNDEAGR